MNVNQGNQKFCGLIHSVRLALFSSLLAIAASGETLELQLEDELGQLAPPSAEARAGELLPVVLGITNLRYRLDRALEDVVVWQETNSTLATHLHEREAHLMDLQALPSARMALSRSSPGRPRRCRR